MKPIVSAFLVLMATSPTLALATPEQDADFAARCSAPDVVKCVAFDSLDEAPMPPPGDYPFDPAPYGIYAGNDVPPVLDTSNAASGNSSLKFTIASQTGANPGSFFTNFSDDFSVQFGEGSPHGKEFYVQWRQKFSRAFIETIIYQSGGSKAYGWKQLSVQEGDRPNENIHSCTDIGIVVHDGRQRRFPQIYHSCGVKDSQYEPLEQPYYHPNGAGDFLLQNAMPDPFCTYSVAGGSDPLSNNCFFYEADQWMTFQLHVKVGTPYKNNRDYKHDSTIQLWVALEGKPSVLAIDFSPKDPACQAQQKSIPACQTGYDLVNKNPLVQHYGQVWLTPYHTSKDSSQTHPDAYTWYDELIISKSRIPDPGVPGDSLAPAAPAEVEVQ